MRIKSYLATVILACLAGGYLIELVLSHQFRLANRASETYTQSVLWEKDLNSLRLDVSQYLITVDLVLGSGQTYLVRGALNKGRFILQSIDLLKKQQSPLPSVTELSDIALSVTRISLYLDEAAILPDNNRDQHLSNLLAHSDNLSEVLVERLDALQKRISGVVDNNLQQQVEARSYITLVQYLCWGGFSLMVLLLWYWANRQISIPLRQLTQMAKNAEEGGLFTGVTRGPKEIVELSDHTQRLTNSLKYQAAHDALTNLSNRREFSRTLSRYAHVTDESVSHVLCFVDLDHFKAVNDTCGHAAGDELLAQVAQVLQSGVRLTDAVARLGGDEFAILLTSCNLQQGREICDDIRKAILDVRYQWGEDIYRISASIGLTLIDVNTPSVEDILNAADTACKVAKDSGRNRLHIFEVGDQTLADKRHDMLLINQINNALDTKHIVLHRQPIIPLHQKHSVKKHYEILLRLKSSDGTLIYPNQFLPLVERFHLGPRLDREVVGAALDWLSEHPAELEALETCAINLSGQSIASHDSLNFIVDKLQQTGLPAEKFCFEITETAAITDLANARQFIAGLKALGCRFALDDFGSGLSSFAYLKTLDVDIIKIDGMFVKDMMADAVNLATVKSINEVANALGKQTVAEFVESEVIAKELRSIGVNYAQGYYYNKPSLLVDLSP
ncbi:putative bifunctional diguanylate cyclase/phosphodiesterase [Neptunomonas qingdaonensis]|uniref:Diguanylate cyclase (GGDEF) domain-containing protein n=1 Tax=Neptunomonas qingdaonensis TaxID=1045558 RepID=A0A1I2V588_9GAMM|nr:EAL domain-containing protein [Neptunomonas qingdaonensis]SFG84565.1 diguanylate cyclase (GGDEF) domain-containing protein [Neptunomonas qingdaonensis]